MNELIKFIANKGEYYIKITDKYIIIYNDHIDVIKRLDKTELIKALNSPLLKMLIK